MIRILVGQPPSNEKGLTKKRNFSFQVSFHWIKFIEEDYYSWNWANNCSLNYSSSEFYLLIFPVEFNQRKKLSSYTDIRFIKVQLCKIGICIYSLHCPVYVRHIPKRNVRSLQHSERWMCFLNIREWENNIEILLTAFFFFFFVSLKHDTKTRNVLRNVEQHNNAQRKCWLIYATKRNVGRFVETSG